MHVLPLPFGLALAVLSRGEASRIRNRGRRPHVPAFDVSQSRPLRQDVLGDPRYSHPRQHVL